MPDAPLTWHYAEGPWFDNNIACLQLRGPSLRMWWMTGQVRDGDHQRPRLAKVAHYALDDEGNPPPKEGLFAKATRRLRQP